MNVTAVITVRGTKKSERAGGLDAGEVSQFTIAPGQYDATVSNPSDLIAQIDRSAYSRGEWIASLRIDGVDVVEHIIAQALKEAHGDLDAVMQALSEMGMFCNADADDLRPIVLLVENARQAE
ncbi:MAG: hypothetical protein HS128_11190 [Ideonella sp.]|nr:hypothetical protein [Ideonella sp.]